VRGKRKGKRRKVTEENKEGRKERRRGVGSCTITIIMMR
jgi:hypothetical protein